MKKIFMFLAISSLLFVTGCSNETDYETVEISESDVVVFNDENLEKIIRNTINKETGDIIGSDMLEVYSLSLNGKEEDKVVSDLEGLQYAINLDSISILHNEIKSLDPISNLENLTYFNLSYSKLLETPNLKNPILNSASFIDVKLDNVDFVKNLSTLKNLTLSSCDISDISSLENLDDIEILNLSDNNIKDISALGDKALLVSLNLQNNQVSNINSLATNPKLNYLVLSYNNVSDLSPLMSLDELEEFRIYEDLDKKIASRSQINALVTKGIDVYYHQ